LGELGEIVLVTGAAGFIGSHLVERLVRSGEKVRAFVRYNSRNDFGALELLPPGLLADVDVFTGDLENPEAVRSAVAGCDTIFHLGALIPIPYSYRHPREFVTVNVEGTLNVLEAVRHAGVRRLVHVSTSEVYGTAQTVPIDEQHPLHPQSPYAATKVAADQLVLSYERSFDLPAVIARPFNTFGPRQSARAVIPTILAQALAGDDVRLGALDPTRDFVFVEDTVEGIIACGTAGRVEGEVFNLGTGVERSIGDVVSAAGQALGRELVVVVDEERLRPSGSEVERLVADASKAAAGLGWRPLVDFAAGIARTAAWVGGALDAYKPRLYNI
jgi:NAD dependent epimerase/dehydratase